MKLKDMSKKANFGLLQTAAIAFVVVTILLTIGSDIVSDVQSDQTAGTYAYNASTAGLEGLGDIAGNLTTIATVVGAVILLGFLGVRLFGGKR